MSRTVHKLKINSSVLCGAVTIQELFSRSWVQKFKKIKINQIKRRLKKKNNNKDYNNNNKISKNNIFKLNNVVQKHFTSIKILL